ncbi:unnamed protein product [Polarella glacialis]|uniref:Protochlorophyllide reductase n=2 Tax=Polarella glacialis TaxID=89957 RepID=A0A813J6B0_POLGL|nr:unnamed protein product [Polarella glacialis]
MGLCGSSSGGPSNAYFDEYVNTLPSMKGKVVAITGCTSGTGRIFARVCAKNGAKIVMLNRASERADDAFQFIKGVAFKAQAPAPVFIPCDLTSFKSVRAAGEHLAKDFSGLGLDVLCNNADLAGVEDKATEDGCDIQMQTNHLSHFMLTAYCMPLLEKAASLRGEARIVNHSSLSRVMELGPMWDNTLQEKYLEKNGGKLGGSSGRMLQGGDFERYQQSKLANVVFTYALNDRLQAKGSKVKALVAHPGAAPTQGIPNMMSGGGGKDVVMLPQCAWTLVAHMMMQSQEDATIGILRSGCDPAAKSGEFYGPLGLGGGTGKPDASENRGPHGVLKEEPFASAEARALLWTTSEKTIGTRFAL